ncbi:hypothetical protein JHN52_20165 [Streptomyces sp. MBT97]|uniref:hypothetical protein n=1 Tax=Streptomyces sp. MBT97 TaxID=2800411 RepID=UPI00190D451A|nr:hypothetical protein [Streptomyces sp. MBT97]MBK3635204.1 hypothetical protein [Streptomyces sp. MBT97]
MSVRSAWLLPNGQTREDTRLTPVGTYAPESEMRTRDGVIAGGNPFAATSAGAMSVQIGTGRALVQGTDAQGAYPVSVDAPVTLTFTDGEAQFARIDSVAVRVYDQLFDQYGQNLATVEIIRGTGSATPTAPSMPSACLRLWDVTVPPGASAGTGGIPWSSALGDRRRFTSAYGGIIPRGYGLAFNGSYDGQYRDNGAGLERWNAAAGAWAQYPATPTRPVVTAQAADPPLNQTGAFVDFTAAAWPRLTFTVPPSGAVFVTIGGQVSNRTTTASTAWMTWRATGAYTEAHGGPNGISAQSGRVIASRRVYRPGLTPGGQVTLIPGWNISSGSTGGTDVFVRDGQLTVEFVQ